MTLETHNGQRQFVLPKALAEPVSPSARVGFVPKRAQKALKAGSNEHRSSITRENTGKARSSAPLSFESSLTALAASTTGEHTTSANAFPTDGISLTRFSGLEGFDRPAQLDHAARSIAQDAAPSSLLADIDPSTPINSAIFRRANKHFVPYAAPQSNALNTPIQPTTTPLNSALQIHPGSVARNSLGTPKAMASDVKQNRVLNLAPPSRSATPALSQQEIESHGPVDYAVFHSLMIAQGKKEKLLKQKDETLEQLQQHVQELEAKNSVCANELNHIKQQTRKYIQDCDKLVRTTQQEMTTYRQSSKEAYDRLLEETRAEASEWASIRTNMRERIEDLEAQLDQIQEQYKKVAPELLREAEISKHQADFLRDKLLVATSDLADAKNRIQELEHGSSQDKI
ncbi:16684_t:CDS:2, partial [Acaulospora colombiana]